MPVPAHEIDQALDNELNAARQLLALLKDEQRHLLAADTDALIGVTEQKSAFVTRMSEASSRRSNAFAANDIESTAPAVQKWLARVDAKTSGAWNELLAVAAEAKELNRTNGLLIARHMTNNQHALQILQGNANVGRFYGPDGQSTAASGGRTFAVG